MIGLKGSGPASETGSGTHRGFGHVPPLSDVLAVFFVGHADPLFGHHLVCFSVLVGLFFAGSARFW